MSKWPLGSFCGVLPKGLHICCKLSPLSKFPILPTFIQVFGRFIGLGLLECPKGPLVYEQTSLPISRGCVGFIYTQSSIVYLRNWALCGPNHCFFILS